MRTKWILRTCFLASQVAAFGGSLIIATGGSIVDPLHGTVRYKIKDFFFLFYIYSAYSWLVITPVCLLIAMPLKLMVAPRWGWLKQTLLCALVGGALALPAGVALGEFSEHRGGNRLSTAASVFGIGAFYAAISGLAEWWFTKRLESKGTVARELPVEA